MERVKISDRQARPGRVPVPTRLPVTGQRLAQHRAEVHPAALAPCGDLRLVAMRVDDDVDRLRRVQRHLRRDARVDMVVGVEREEHQPRRLVDLPVILEPFHHPLDLALHHPLLLLQCRVPVLHLQLLQAARPDQCVVRQPGTPVGVPVRLDVQHRRVLAVPASLRQLLLYDIVREIVRIPLPQPLEQRLVLRHREVLYHAQPGDPVQIQPTPASYIVTQLRGRHVRLRVVHPWIDVHGIVRHPVNVVVVDDQQFHTVRQLGRPLRIHGHVDHDEMRHRRLLDHPLHARPDPVPPVLGHHHPVGPPPPRLRERPGHDRRRRGPVHIPVLHHQHRIVRVHSLQVVHSRILRRLHAHGPLRAPQL